MYLISGTAFLIYITKVPERWFIGKCDYLGHSHNWWHFFVVAALYYWHNTGLLIFSWFLIKFLCTTFFFSYINFLCSRNEICNFYAFKWMCSGKGKMLCYVTYTVYTICSCSYYCIYNFFYVVVVLTGMSRCFSFILELFIYHVFSYLIKLITIIRWILQVWFMWSIEWTMDVQLRWEMYNLRIIFSKFR